MNKESKNQSDTEVHLSEKTSLGGQASGQVTDQATDQAPSTCICEQEFGSNEDCPHCYPIYMINIKP